MLVVVDEKGWGNKAWDLTKKHSTREIRQFYRRYLTWKISIPPHPASWSYFQSFPNGLPHEMSVTHPVTYAPRGNLMLQDGST
jgi:hypothetical protein